MPLNILRLNHAPSSHPNDRIVFIKPLPRPPSDQASYETADTFLRAIAAQCLPIMKSYHLSVTTLEEHEPNNEFIGRNFNNGECLQLVLRTKSGGWVSFQMVQMVMMHELAHNLHMNHSKSFWETRNKFSNEMRGLWAKGFTGEGFWGGGRAVGDLSTRMGNNIVPSEELADLPICGGTFRSRRRKRKNVGEGGRELTWKERRNKRIEKRFGKNGQSLGEDENKRLLLDISKKGPIGGKPRVAGSKRGRELRASAALARFGTNKNQEEDLKPGDATDDDSGDEYEEAGDQGDDATDINGQRMLDSLGFGLVRTCDDEDCAGDEAQVKRELAELEALDDDFSRLIEGGNHILGANAQQNQEQKPSREKRNPIYDIPEYEGSPSPPSSRSKSGNAFSTHSKREFTISKPSVGLSLEATTLADESVPSNGETEDLSIGVSCPICSMSNDRGSPTCLACSNVLIPAMDLRHWQCKSEVCEGSEYLNAGDCGICGVCGTRKA